MQTLRRASKRHMCRMCVRLPNMALKSSRCRASKAPSDSALTFAARTSCKPHALPCSGLVYQTQNSCQDVPSSLNALACK